MSVWNYVGIYFLGGVTLIPGVVLLGYYLAPQQQPKITLKDSLPKAEEEYSDQFLGPVQASASFYMSPYFVNLGEQDDEFVLSKVKARQQLKKSLDPATPAPKTTLAKIPKYYGSVRGSLLQIFGDEMHTKHVSTIKLQEYIVTLWPLGAEDFELFYKKYPICLISRSGPDGLVALDMHPNSPPQNAHYIYVDNPCAKEDLYFALISGSRTVSPDQSIGPRDPQLMARPIDLDQEDIHELLNRIYSSSETPQTQWVNALLGRLFLAVKASRQLDTYVRQKIIYKLTRVKPSFISHIEVQNVHIGSSLPYFNDVRLKTFSVDGNMTLEGEIVYSGGFSLDIAFTCVLKVPGLARREFQCVLAVKLQSLKGTLVVRVKPPPSSHLWYAFKEMPEMDLKIEPTVANRQVNYSFVTNALNSMISDAIKESMVLPFMDDIPFCDTSDEFYRGGIWDASSRPTNVAWSGERREERKSFDSEHDVVLKDDASIRSTSSSAVAFDEEQKDDVAAPASAPRPIAKFWGNLIRRAPKTEASVVADNAINIADTPSTASTAGASAGATSASESSTARSSPAPSVPLTPAANTTIPSPRSSKSSASTTAVTNASVHGVQSRLYMPPESFASRKPVPGVVTATNADFDPTKEPKIDSEIDQREDDDNRKIPRKPVPAHPLRASNSFQHLSRVVSRSQTSQATRKGHSPSSSISQLSTSSKRSNASYRRTVTLQNLQPEPEPRD